MSVPAGAAAQGEPPARRQVGALTGLIVLVLVLGVVVVVAIIVAGRGRDGFDTGSTSDITSALQDHGLTVCATRRATAHHDSGGARSTEEIDVALPGGCADAVPVQLDAYADASHRDAAARNAEVHLRPRTFGTVYTWNQYTVYLQGDAASADPAVRDRIVDALESVGAQ